MNLAMAFASVGGVSGSDEPEAHCGAPTTTRSVFVPTACRAAARAPSWETRSSRTAPGVGSALLHKSHSRTHPGLRRSMYRAAAPALGGDVPAAVVGGPLTFTPISGLTAT